MNKAKHFLQRLKRPLRILPLIVLVACSKQVPSSDEGQAQAKGSGATVEAIEFIAYEETENGPQLQIKAELDVTLDPELINAALRGVPLNFVYEIEVTEPWLYFFENSIPVSDIPFIFFHRILYSFIHVDKFFFEISRMYCQAKHKNTGCKDIYAACRTNFFKKSTYHFL